MSVCQVKGQIVYISEVVSSAFWKKKKILRDLSVKTITFTFLPYNYLRSFHFHFPVLGLYGSVIHH